MAESVILSEVVTFSGSAQNLATVLSGDITMKTLLLQADEGNTHAYYVGGNSSVSTKGMRLPAPATGEPHAPFDPAQGDRDDYLRLSDLYVIGTNGEKVRVFGVKLTVANKRRGEL